MRSQPVPPSIRHFDKVVIIGLGLIGSSIARALKTANACDLLVGIDANLTMLNDGRQLDVIDEIGRYDSQTFDGADLVILATPMGAIRSAAEKALPLLGPNTTLTDVGSAKQSVISAIIDANDGKVPLNFVPGHPIAGTENNGVRAGFATLFNNRITIITPLEETAPQAIKVVKSLWQICGASVQSMSVSHHDNLYAATSHLPHMLAYTLVDNLARKAEKQEIFQFASGGFHDFTRIASSDPVMWRDVALLNKTPILKMLKDYRESLDALIHEIESDDGEAVQTRFQRAKNARDALL